MLALGLAVPQGFVIPNPAGMTAASLAAAVKKLGSKTKPLLLAVRPSVNGQASGYMEAILNVGLNDETVEALAARLNDRPLAYDLYRQFIQNYAVNVLSLRHADFEDIFSAHKGPDLISYYKSFIEKQSGAVFPQGLLEQLQGVVKAAAPPQKIRRPHRPGHGPWRKHSWRRHLAQFFNRRQGSKHRPGFHGKISEAGGPAQIRAEQD